jgi:hypothetical protein
VKPESGGRDVKKQQGSNLQDGHTSGAFSERDEAIWAASTQVFVEEGNRVFLDGELLGSTVAMSCDICHPDATNTHLETYPNYQVHLGRVALLRDMVNWCIENPVRGMPLAEKRGAVLRLHSAARGTLLVQPDVLEMLHAEGMRGLRCSRTEPLFRPKTIPELLDLPIALVRHQDVVLGHVPVDDGRGAAQRVREGMRVVERHGGVAHRHEAEAQGDEVVGPPARARHLHPRGARYEFQRQEQFALGDVQVIDLGDVQGG